MAPPMLVCPFACLDTAGWKVAPLGLDGELRLANYRVTVRENNGRLTQLPQ